MSYRHGNELIWVWVLSAPFCSKKNIGPLGGRALPGGESPQITLCGVFPSVLGQKKTLGYHGFQGVEKAIDLVSQNPPNMSRFFGSRGLR